MVEPDEPREFSQEELSQLARELLLLRRPGFVNHENPNRPDPPFVRPVDYQCKIIAKIDNPLFTESDKVCFDSLTIF